MSMLPNADPKFVNPLDELFQTAPTQEVIDRQRQAPQVGRAL